MIGTVAGNFKILEEIGEGGMGKVYRGVDTMLDREVAIKVLRPELVSQTHLVDRFRSEAMTLAKLNHPNIAMLYAFFQQEQHFYMVMEFVRGETLDKRIRRTGLLAYDQALKVFLYTLEAIGYAHSMNIVHRDIKPNNVMITEAEEVKVMDFGIARVVGSERMTREGSMIGTPEYMAPEQIRGQDVDPRTDIYALGILLYEMLTGRLPFMNQNQFELMRAHIEFPPPPPRKYAPHLPESMETIMLQALSKKKEDRFASAYEFRDAILASPDLPTGALMGRATRSGSAPITPAHFGRVSQAQQALPTSPQQRPAPTDRQTMDVRQFEAQQRAGGQQQRPAQVPQRQQAGPAAQARSADANATQVVSAPLPSAKAATAKKGLPLPLMIGAGVALVLVVAVLLWFLNHGKQTSNPNDPNKGGTTATGKTFKPDLVTLSGGSYRMGRLDEPKADGEEDLAWGYAQWPANTVTVLPFALDRTEVSSEEYAQFVKETNHPAPEDWNGNEPFTGKEQWPVRYVSYEEAEAFAAWRSKRDSTRYRLPTEEEWEFAARNGGDAATTVFPWGNQWTPDLANIKFTEPKIVSAYPQGGTKQGVLNMIGNVGEWTSTPAAYYAGNNKLELDAAAQTAKVVRGGSYISQPDGPKPIRVTVRGFLDAKKKDPTIGFRLVRSQ
ncbi:MAG: SUMF1/EgtB/PvdO family nonheme iron enzyme [Acidobacteria bacterium]|nr:SUMF1/EgtB/PvdO family nonheme iron enzyme [Acidobacteriota bacterium]MBI3424389.1 SUMF1/EgtB/PvdO family nonheme iron enzyme [Acidobacteriota bacterium]